MTIGLQLFLIATVMWAMLAWRGEHAPLVFWRLLWLPVGIAGIALVHFAYWASGKEHP